MCLLRLEMTKMKTENCRQLISTMGNVESGECSKWGVICVYDTLDNYLCIAIFNSSKSCAKFFNTSFQVINASIARNSIVKGRFRIERVII